MKDSKHCYGNCSSPFLPPPNLENCNSINLVQCVLVDCGSLTAAVRSTPLQVMIEWAESGALKRQHSQVRYVQ